MNNLNFESKGEARSYFKGFSVNQLTIMDIVYWDRIAERNVHALRRSLSSMDTEFMQGFDLMDENVETFEECLNKL